MATLHDVARRAGVSIATVSRVLNGTDTVRPDTYKRIMEAARALDYTPNQSAKTLRLGRSSTIALIVSDIEVAVFATLIRYIQESLSRIGLDLLLFTLGHSEERLREVLERLPSLNLQGAVLLSTDALPMRRFKPIMNSLMERGIALLSCAQDLSRHNIPSLYHEDRRATEEAVSYLIGQGKAPVALMGRIKGSATGQERFRGYRKALEKAGIPVDPKLIWDQPYRFAAGYTSLSRALDAGMKLRAVQALSDELAHGVMAAAIDRKLRIPEDIAIIGFSNTEWGANTRPALSTISFSPEILAEKISQHFIDRQNGGEPLLKQVIHRKLMLRDSA